MPIAVSMRENKTKEYKEARDAVSHDLIQYLGQFAKDIIPIPNCLKFPEKYLREYKVELLVLSGGGMTFLRKRTESRLLRYAVSNSIPVVGICHGMQMINLFFGGILTKSIATKVSHVGKNHDVRIVNNSFRNLLGRGKFRVNSFHEDGIGSNDLGSNLEAFAVTSSGLFVEGFSHKKMPIIGVMWHPERKSPSDRENRVLIRTAINMGMW